MTAWLAQWTNKPVHGALWKFVRELDLSLAQEHFIVILTLHCDAVTSCFVLDHGCPKLGRYAGNSRRPALPRFWWSLASSRKAVCGSADTNINNREWTIEIVSSDMRKWSKLCHSSMLKHFAYGPSSPFGGLARVQSAETRLEKKESKSNNTDWFTPTDFANTR